MAEEPIKLTKLTRCAGCGAKARYATFTYGFAYTFLVIVRLCRVDGAIAYADSIQYATFTFLGGYLIYTITQDRHFYAVVQFYCFVHRNVILNCGRKVMSDKRI